MTRTYWCCGCAIGAILLGSNGANAQTAVQSGQPNTVDSQNSINAQVPAAVAPPPGQERQLTEIIVTAQRRSENLVNVPVAVTVLSSQALEKQAITSERDLQIAVPGLTVKAALTSDQLNYSIRGQTIDPFTFSQPGVLPYVDEFQVPQGLVSEALYDLDSIQVLKGPQGTLFGRNAIGGAVLITTAQPTFNYSGFAKAQAGDYGYYQFEGDVNLPISDKLALRVATQEEHTGGYFKNLTTGNSLGKEDNDSVRVSLLFKPTPQLSNTLVVEFTDVNGTPTPARLYSEYPLGSTNNGIPLSPTGPGFFSPQGADAVFGPGFFEAYVKAAGLANTAAAGGLTAYFNSIKGQSPNSDVSLNADPTVHGKVIDLINTTTYKLNGDTQIKAIVGYTSSQSNQSTDSDGTPFGIESPSFANDIYQFSSELQISGKLLDHRLQYTAGGYFFNSLTTSDEFATVFSFAPILPPLETENLLGHATDEAYAVYAQGTYDLSDFLPGVELTGGVRYTNETQRLKQEPGGLFYTTFGSAPERSNIAPTNYEAGLNYHITHHAMLYGKVGTSFRSGGFNIGAAPEPGTAADGGNAFLPEKTISYEFGAKFEGRLATAPIRADLAVFHQTVDNVQRSVYFVPPGGALSGFTANIPQSRVQGVEADGLISPTSWLQLGVNASFDDAAFTKPTAEFFGETQTYGPYPDTPKFSGSLFGEIDLPFWHDIGDFSLRGDAFHQSSTFFGSLNNTSVPGTQIPAYTIVNFRVAVDNVLHSPVSAAFYLKNAFDEQYYAGGIPLGAVFSLNTAVPGPPRTFFFELSAKF